MLGPIGRGFAPSPARPRALLIGGGVGIPPMVFLADALRRRKDARWQPLVLMGSEIPFPFRARPSTLLVPGMPAGVIACMPLLEDWGVPSRLASLAGFPGCFEGYVTDLAAAWLASLDAAALAEVEVFACGPTPMLKAAAGVARRYGVPCQVSLEEFMACAVGGCAGCAVPVVADGALAMKRVCVDGPVFDANAVFPEKGTGSAGWLRCSQPSGRVDSPPPGRGGPARRTPGRGVSPAAHHDSGSLQRLKMVPRTISVERTPNGRWYRGIVEAAFARSGPRRPPARTDASSRLGYTASTRRLVTPLWHRRAGGHRGIGEPAFGPGVSWAATTSDPLAGRRRGPLGSHDSATIPRYRCRRGVRRPNVRGTILSSATTLDRGQRPSEAPGPSAGE